MKRQSTKVEEELRAESKEKECLLKVKNKKTKLEIRTKVS